MQSLDVDYNPLSNTAITVQIPQVTGNGVEVNFNRYSDENCLGLEGEGEGEGEGEEAVEGEGEGEEAVEGEGEEAVEGEGEGEGEVPDDSPCGCNGKTWVTPKHLLGDWLLIGFSLLAVVGICFR